MQGLRILLALDLLVCRLARERLILARSNASDVDNDVIRLFMLRLLLRLRLLLVLLVAILLKLIFFNLQLVPLLRSWLKLSLLPVFFNIDLAHKVFSAGLSCHVCQYLGLLFQL